MTVILADDCNTPLLSVPDTDDKPNQLLPEEEYT
jgi:hypothetical protein